MKKQIGILLLIMLLTLGCTQQNVKTPIDSVQIEIKNEVQPTDIRPNSSYKNRTIKIGVLEFYPPYEYMENGTMTGPGVEVVREAFTRMGYDFEIKPYPWVRILNMLKTGELDIGLDIYHTDERNDYLEFPESKYAVYPYVLFKRKDNPIAFSGDLNDLKNYSIGIIRGYSYGSDIDPLLNNNAYHFEASDSINQNFEKLENGRIDLIIEVLSSGNLTISEMGYNDSLEPINYVLSEDIAYPAFSKKNNLRELITEYDITFKNMVEDGSYEEIFNHFNEKGPY